VQLDGEGIAVSNVPTTDADMGLKVNVGVRPEDLVETDKEEYLYDGTVNILEALGELTVLYFEAEHGRDPVIAKLPGIHNDLRGKVVRLSAAPGKVHLFANGKSLLYR
jgi:alpha-glucoside transport system ATP-binding protein